MILDAALAAAAALACVIFAAWIYRFNEVPLEVPLAYSGDALYYGDPDQGSDREWLVPAQSFARRAIRLGHGSISHVGQHSLCDAAAVLPHCIAHDALAAGQLIPPHGFVEDKGALVAIRLAGDPTRSERKVLRWLRELAVETR